LAIGLCERQLRWQFCYLGRIHELAGRPGWCHLLKNDCTLRARHASRAAGTERVRFDPRYLLYGLIDRSVYGNGGVDTSLDFEELRRRSHSDDAARATGDAEDFSAWIRATLPALGPAAI
jgi:hypothetical protein